MNSMVHHQINPLPSYRVKTAEYQHEHELLLIEGLIHPNTAMPK